jgi:transposase
MTKKYIVRLEPREREDLHKLVSKGKGAARKLTHARILLKADDSEGRPGWTDERIAEALGVTRQTVEHVRQRCVEQGLEAALERKKREHGPTLPILDGAKEAKLVAICCSKPPPGRRRWTLHLLADRLVELNIVESISPDTVRRALKKKRAEAVAQADVVHSAGAERRVRLRHGKRTGGVPSSVRRQSSCSVHG